MLLLYLVFQTLDNYWTTQRDMDALDESKQEAIGEEESVETAGTEETVEPNNGQDAEDNACWQVDTILEAAREYDL